jgi:cell wall-associated NlpC family hydrolase
MVTGLRVRQIGNEMINPLQQIAQTTVFQDSASKKPASAAASPFDSLLNSLHNAGEGSTGKAQEAAVELLRIEMMQNTLSLAGDSDSSMPSATRALESLLSGLGACTPHRGFPKQAAQGVPAGDSEALDELAAAVSGKGDEKADEIGKSAAEFLGTPYRFGGEGANGIDCSSFVQQVFRENQITLPRTAREQMKVGSEVAAGDLRKGDLVFFHTYASYPSHVGIYLGDGKMIHASSAKGEVTVSNMNTDYYRSRFLGAKRLA